MAEAHHGVCGRDLSSTARPTHHEAPTGGVQLHADAHGEPWQLHPIAMEPIIVLLSPDQHGTELAAACVGAIGVAPHVQHTMRLQQETTSFTLSCIFVL